MGAAVLAATAIVGTIVGTIQTAGAQKQAGEAAAATARYQAQVAANNKIIAENKAEDARKRGEIAAQGEEVRGRQQAALLAADAAARGVEVGTGSALDLTADETALAKTNALTIRSNAERERVAFLNQAVGFEAEQGLKLQAGESAIAGAKAAATGTLISGATSVAGKWHSFKTEGTF